MATNIFGSEQKSQPVQEVLRWLQQTEEEWLLVFDNAPNSGLSRYLPDGDRGNVLYTTRHRNLQPRLRPECIEAVEEMEIQDAVRLLLLSAQLPEDKANEELARDIVRKLGFLPLAIDQAGAYIHMAPCPLDRYLILFDEQKEALLRNPKFKGGDEQRHLAVYACFNISYRAIQVCADQRGDTARAKDADVALKILRLICFYHNEGNLGSIFEHAAWNRHAVNKGDDFPLKAGNIELDELILAVDTEIAPETPKGCEWLCDEWVGGMTLLNDYSLIQLDTEVGYSNMHVLIHDWARNRMEEQERREWGSAARCLLLDSLTVSRDHAGILYRQLAVPHLQVVLQYANIVHDDLQLESEYQTRMAKVFQQIHNLEAAETALQTALEHLKRELGLLDLNTLAVMSQLGHVYLDQGQYLKAEEIFLEVIEQRKLFHREMRWRAAQETRSKTQNADTPAQTPSTEEYLDVESIRSDTRKLLRALIKQDSREAYEQVLLDFIQWSEKRHGSGSRETQKYRYWLATLCSGADLEKENAARKFEQTTEDVYEELENTIAEYGPGHFRAKLMKTHLGRLLAKDGAFPEAFQILGEVLEWNELVHGKDSIPWADSASDIADLMIQQNRPYEADSILLLTVDRYEATLGEQHPKTLNAFYLLSFCHARKADYSKAITAMEICFNGRKTLLGSSHLLTRMSETTLKHWRNSEIMIPEWTRARINNSAIETSKAILGILAPQWMKDWKPGAFLAAFPLSPFGPHAVLHEREQPFRLVSV